MNLPKWASTSLVLSSILVGCSQAPEKKIIPVVTPEKQAELDKQHQESKAQREAEAAAAGTAK